LKSVCAVENCLECCELKKEIPAFHKLLLFVKSDIRFHRVKETFWKRAKMMGSVLRNIKTEDMF
jgi:hypothetical protein